MNYTSIEQSKKLLELGLSPESADFEYKCVGFTMHTTRPTDDFKYKVMLKEQNIPHEPKYDIPCWSLGALLELMPKHIFSEDRIKNYTPVLHIGEKKVIWYQHMNEFLHIEHTDTSIESAYNMVVWLLENNYIKKNRRYDYRRLCFF